MSAVTEKLNEPPMKLNEPPMKLTIKTNRYTYSNEVVERLSAFAKVHEYDERKEFKEAWTKWMEEPEISVLISAEVARLAMSGLTGDIQDRMYKSARYYYRKKEEGVINTEPTIRKEYIGLPRSVLRSIDEHIYSEIKRSVMENGITSKIAVTAARSFTTYCKLHYEVISDMLSIDYNDPGSMREELKQATDRLKKTYKNRFYNIKVALQEMGEEVV